MNTKIVCAASFAVAMLAFAQASPSSAASFATPGGSVEIAVPAIGAGAIVPVFDSRTYADPYYGQRWWWEYHRRPHRHGGKVRIVKSRYAYGCGYYNCYTGKFGYRNRTAYTMGIFGYTYPSPTRYPEIGFGVVVH
jgi:hypothetical protein